MKTLLLLIVLFISYYYTDAQERTVQGIVTTFDSIAVINAKVMSKNSKLIVKTDSLGQFSIVLKGSDKLKVSANGFGSQTFKVDEKTKLVAVNLKLKTGDKAREYAIGYGHVSNAEKLNAVAQMTNKDVDFSQYSSMHDLIRGRFAGVTVQNNGDIIIRGVNSINSSSAALIVVDGIPTNQSILYSIVPSNVQSINVLKDGGSAIYGSRGANGVVIIETKKGFEDN